MSAEISHYFVELRDDIEAVTGEKIANNIRNLR